MLSNPAIIMVVFNVIIEISNKYCLNQNQLEWGCPNGTKYPPRQPIQTPQVMRLKIILPNRATLPNRARVYRRTDGQTDGRTG